MSSTNAPEKLDAANNASGRKEASRVKPFVSVIIPVRNEADFIERSLGSVLNQDYPWDRFEVIIADGMSTDDTRAIAMRAAADRDVRIIDNPGKIAPTALNSAIRVGKGDIFIRVDGHCEVAADYVSQCVRLLQERRCDGVGGPIETISQTPAAEAIAIAMSSPFGVGGNSFRTVKDREIWADTVPFPAYPRELFARVGLFDEEMVRSQDSEFNARVRKAGGRLLLSPAVRSRYYSRSSLRSLWRQYLQYGCWKVRVLQKHPRQLAFRHFVPALFAITWVSLAVASIFSHWARLAFATLAALYVTAVFFASVVTAARTKWKHLPRLFVVFAILHLSWGIGFLQGLWRFRARWGDHEGRTPRADWVESETSVRSENPLHTT